MDCFLFTDLILVCKAPKRMDKFKIIRPPMRLDQLVVSELKDKGWARLPLTCFLSHLPPCTVLVRPVNDALSELS